MFRALNRGHSAEFNAVTVQRMREGCGVNPPARELRMSPRTLRNWLKASEYGKLTGPGAMTATPEQISAIRCCGVVGLERALERANTFDPDLDLVAGIDELVVRHTDSSGRAGQDHVARVQRHPAT
jgi:transposase